MAAKLSLKELAQKTDRLGPGHRMCAGCSAPIIVRQILKGAGFAGFFEGFNPWRISDETLMEKTADLPLLRFQPLGVGSGASDAGGWAWILAIALTLLIVLAFVR